jgi:hypothetical protein
MQPVYGWETACKGADSAGLGSWRRGKQPDPYFQKENAVPGPVTGWHPWSGRGVVLPRERGIKRLYYVQFTKSHRNGRALE